MSISGTIVIGEVAHGTPRSLLDPMGIWYATAELTGDGSGGSVTFNFTPQQPGITPTLPDLRQRYLYICDGVFALDATADPGNATVNLFNRDAAIGAAPPMQLSKTVDTLPSVGTAGFLPSGDLLPDAAKRFPMFWITFPAATQIMISVQFQNNINLDGYTARVFGRYWDRQVRTVPGFPDSVMR